MRTNKCAILQSFLPLCFLILPSANATTLSDNLSAPTYYTELINSNTWIAAGFSTDSATYQLSSVTALFQVDTSGPLTVSLYSNTSQGGNLFGQPGTDLGTLSNPGSFATTLQPTTFGGNSLNLAANTTYWIVMAGNGAAQYEWGYASDNSGSGPGFVHTWGTSSDLGGTWYTDGLQPMQMRVDASVTPEPAEWTVLLIGTCGLAGIYWRRRRHANGLR